MEVSKKQRLIEAVNFLISEGILRNKSHFGELVGIVSSGNLSQVLSDKYDRILTESQESNFLSKFPIISPVWYYTGKGPMLKATSEEPPHLPSVDGRLVADDAESYADAVAKYGGQLVPEYNAEFRGGDRGATLHSSDLVGHWLIPNAPKGSFIVTMVGRSMEPQIASGSKLLLAPMHFDPRMPLSIPFGQIFGLVVRDSEEVEADGTFSAHIKILRRHKEKALERSVWVASSVNSEQFDDFEIPISRVTHLYKVLTSINALWGY